MATDPKRLTRADTARTFGVSATTVDGWISRGLPHDGSGRSKRFDPAAVHEWLVAEAVRRATPDVAPIEILDEARQRKMAAEAELTELELQRARGEVVPIQVVIELLAGVLSNIRTRLEGIPSKVCRVLVEMIDASSIEERLEEEIREALEELADGDHFGERVVEREREARARKRAR